jgi:hypothetical protein
MRKNLLIVGLFLTSQMFAQTGIGTTTPDASAKLDVSSTSKGFLPPRVALTGVYDVSTIPNPATGLLVYCTGTGGLASGYYFFNGTAWATIATEGGSGSVAAEFGTQILGSSVAVNSATPVDVLSFTLPSAGTWEIIYFLRAQGAAGFAGEFGLYDPSGTIVPNSEILAAFGEQASTGTGVVRVTTTGSVTYKLKAWASYGTYGVYSEFNGRTGVTWKKISGNAPVTGQSVDYVQASLSTNQSLSSVGNINFNVSSGAGITITTGGFNLLANKTYKLEAALGGTSGGYAYYGWVDNTNTLLSGGSIGAVMKAGTVYTDAPQDKAVVYFTPTVNTTVYLRVYSLSGTLTAYAPSTSSNYSSSWANITQIGSSAFVSPWTLSGTDTYNTSGNVGIGTSTPSASALLDLTSTSKGLLPPRVALTTKSGTTTIASPTTGLIVYNTASAGTGGDAVTPGYYFFNGTIWTRMDPEGWSTPVAITFGAPSGSTSPTKGASPTYDYVRYRNLGGKEYEVEYNFVQVNTGTAGNSDYLITLPGGLKFDFTASGQTAYTGATGINAISARLVSAFGDLFHVSAHNSATAVPYDATRFRIHTNSWGSVGWTFYNYTYYQLSVEKSGFKMTFKFKAA